MGLSWAVLGRLGPVLRLSWAVLGRLGPVLWPFWAVLEPSWAVWAPSWGRVRPSWAVLEPSWAVWGAFGAVLGSCFLGPSGRSGEDLGLDPSTPHRLGNRPGVVWRHRRPNRCRVLESSHRLSTVWGIVLGSSGAIVTQIDAVFRGPLLPFRATPGIPSALHPSMLAHRPLHPATVATFRPLVPTTACP